MLFRDIKGNLVKIDRYDYTNDLKYFSKIQDLFLKKKEENTNNSQQLMDDILSKL
tara:strand:+ start:539 stop:703 length:165 start_codon:yes stop_codon:yes gene_type:complete